MRHTHPDFIRTLLAYLRVEFRHDWNQKMNTVTKTPSSLKTRRSALLSSVWTPHSTGLPFWLQGSRSSPIPSVPETPKLGVKTASPSPSGWEEQSPHCLEFGTAGAVARGLLTEDKRGQLVASEGKTRLSKALSTPEASSQCQERQQLPSHHLHPIQSAE